MTIKTRSMMGVVAILICSIGCFQISHRLGRPSVHGFPDSQMSFAEAQFHYKVATLNMNRFVRRELLAQDPLPEYYLQAFEQLQKTEITGFSSFQEFNRLQNILNNFHAQRLTLGMKSRQKTPLKIHRFLAELRDHEDRVAELQARCFSLLQQKQQHQVAFLFAADSL